MAVNCSFDIVSQINAQELDNAVNQTVKEITQRYDFKGSQSTVTRNDEEIVIHTEDDFKMQSIVEILKTKMIKRNVSVKFLEPGKVEKAMGSTIKQVFKLKNGISKEKSKEIIQEIKNMKIKVQPQIMEDVIRVNGKNKDDLQGVIQILREKDFDIELQFINFRS